MLLWQSFYGLNKSENTAKKLPAHWAVFEFGTILIGFNPSTKMLTSSMMFEASDLQVSILQSPLKKFLSWYANQYACHKQIYNDFEGICSKLALILKSQSLNARQINSLQVPHDTIFLNVPDWLWNKS